MILKKPQIAWFVSDKIALMDGPIVMEEVNIFEGEGKIQNIKVQII